MELENYSKEERIDNSSTSNGQYVDHEKVALSKYMTSVYKMMCYALLLTGASAWVVAHSETLRNIFLGSFWIWALVELGLVIAISAGIQKFEARTLNILFVIYSIVNGLTLSSIFLVFDLGLIETAFFITAGTFGACSFIGYKIKNDLYTIGRIAFFVLIGGIIATIVNIFMASSTLDWIINYAMVGVFVILTAYDTQKLKNGGFHYLAEEDQQRWVVYGALELYLDFINLFLYILKILGRSRD